MKKVLIIPAAGLATRLRPLSNTMSKAMVPIAGKPVIAHILDSVKDNVDHVVVVHGGNADLINFINFVKNRYSFQIDLVKQTVINGPLTAIRNALHHLECFGDEELKAFIWLGDTLVSSKQEIDTKIFDMSYPFIATSQVEDYSRWCMVYTDADKNVMHMVNKPTTGSGGNAAIGIYYVGDAKQASAICDEVYKNEISGEYDISLLLEKIPSLKNVNINSWVDCGDLPSLVKANSVYINSKARANHHVFITQHGTVVKSTSEAECNWYKEAQKNAMIRRYTPQVISITDSNIELEMCSGQSLQDLLVYDNIRVDVWKQIIERVFESYVDCFCDQSLGYESGYDSHHMFVWNLEQRLYTIRDLLDMSQSEVDIVRGSIDKILSNLRNIRQYDSSLMHGDFHFGNIIYDASCDKIKMIDPRGSWCNNITVEGNTLYDLAKFYQSFYCGYSWLVNGMPIDENLSKAITAFVDEEMNSIEVGIQNLVKLISANLLFSCIPFHKEDLERCKAFKDKAIALMKEL